MSDTNKDVDPALVALQNNAPTYAILALLETRALTALLIAKKLITADELEPHMQTSQQLFDDLMRVAQRLKGNQEGL